MATIKEEPEVDSLFNLRLKYFNAIENNDCSTLINLSMTSQERIWEFLDQEGSTGLIRACDLDFLDTTRTLLEIVRNRLGDMSELRNWVNSKSDSGFTALHYSAYRGNLRAAKLILTHGGNVSIKNDNGLNIMHLAAQGNQITVMAYFKEFHGFSYFCLDNANSSPLHWAAYSGSIEAFDFLIAQGSDINNQDKDGSTPLHLAALTERKKIAGKLMKMGADYNIRDNNDRKPIDVSISKGDEVMMDFFSERMSLVSATCDSGNCSTWNFVVFFLVMLVWSEVFFFYVVLKESSSQVFLGVSVILGVLLLSIYMRLVLMDPGYKKRRNNKTIKTLVEEEENLNNYCSYCLVINQSDEESEDSLNYKLKHCYICNKCVNNYDHHCYWVNNCIGARSFHLFTVFLTSLLINSSYKLYHLIVFCLKGTSKETKAETTSTASVTGAVSSSKDSKVLQSSGFINFEKYFFLVLLLLAVVVSFLLLLKQFKKEVRSCVNEKSSYKSKSELLLGKNNY